MTERLLEIRRERTVRVEPPPQEIQEGAAPQQQEDGGQGELAPAELRRVAVLATLRGGGRGPGPRHPEGHPKAEDNPMPNAWRGRGRRGRTPLRQRGGRGGRDPAHSRLSQQDPGSLVFPDGNPSRPRSHPESDRQPGEEGEGTHQVR